MKEGQREQEKEVEIEKKYKSGRGGDEKRSYEEREEILPSITLIALQCVCVISALYFINFIGF